MVDFSKNLKNLRIDKGLSQQQIAEKIGVGANTISNYEKGRSTPDYTILEKLIKYLDVDYNELLGTNTFQQGIVKESTHPYLNKEQKGVPFYDVDFIGGFNLVFNNQDQTPAFYINYPPFNDADLWVNITGSSMSPKIDHGDLVALKKIENSSWQQFLLLGEVYAVVADDFRTIKIISKGKDDNHFNLIPFSKSDEYSEQQIPKKLIKHLFKVLGSIKKLF